MAEVSEGKGVLTLFSQVGKQGVWRRGVRLKSHTPRTRLGLVRRIGPVPYQGVEWSSARDDFEPLRVWRASLRG